MRRNDLLGWLVFAVVALSPIPLGSNPPIFWAISGTLVGLVSLVYFGQVMMSGEGLRFPVRGIRLLAWLFAALVIFLLVQTVPIGVLLGPFQFASGREGEVEAQTLSLAPGSTWMMVIRMLSYGLFFLLVAQVGANERRAEKLMTFIFWSVVAHGAFGLIQLTQLGDTLLGAEKTYYQGVATGTFVNRNSYATFMAMGMAIGMGVVVQAILEISNGVRRLGEALPGLAAVIGGLLVILLALAASQSRMGLLSAIVAICVVILLALRWIRWSSVPQLLIFGFALATAVGATLLYFGSDLIQRIVMTEATGGGRTFIYDQTLDMIRTRTWTGYGGGAFELAFPLFQAPPLNPDFLFDKAHSTYLTLWVELGLIAGSLPIAIVALLFGAIVVQYFRIDIAVGVKIGAIGAIVAAALHSTIDFSLEMQANTYLFVAMLGLARSVAARRRHEP